MGNCFSSTRGLKPKDHHMPLNPQASGLQGLHDPPQILPIQEGGGPIINDIRLHAPGGLHPAPLPRPLPQPADPHQQTKVEISDVLLGGIAKI